MPPIPISLRVNGEDRVCHCDPRDTLLNVLRDGLSLSGTKEGCSNGNCGACTILIDGSAVCACLVMALEAQDYDIMTIEGLADHNGLHPIQDAIVKGGGTQCGFCTPGIIMSAVALLKTNPRPTAQDIRHAIAGNICRCTGYDKIVSAIAEAAQTLSSKSENHL
ncbi:MAG: (2Fe-2S)-binding protein [Hyphomicrobiaceae bacterium]